MDESKGRKTQWTSSEERADECVFRHPAFGAAMRPDGTTGTSRTSSGGKPREGPTGEQVAEVV